MAHAQIISSITGDPIYEGPPKYVGTYRAPGYIEFREIASTSPIEWHAGDYVDYERTGKRYKLYRSPQQTKQAGTMRYGAAFLYENVQFFDGSKDLEFCRFIDLVPEDNNIHFSTIDTFSFWGNVYNVAERIEACMGYWRPNDTWKINVVSGLTDPSFASLVELLHSYQDFSAQGMTCLDVLDKVYDMWGLGWEYEIVDGENVITIGAPNVLTSSNSTKSFYYGWGLTRLKCSVSNVDELGTRLYAYGSTRNMYATYYRDMEIKDAASVNIAHLMIPVSYWGTTEVEGQQLPDASKAYLENVNAIDKFGLIPKYVYFDGTDSSLPEIYPSIEGATIQDVWDAKDAAGDSTNYPDQEWYGGSERIDEIVSGDTIIDDGVQSYADKQYQESNIGLFAPVTDSFTVPAGDHTEYPIYRDFSITTTIIGEKSITFNVGPFTFMNDAPGEIDYIDADLGIRNNDTAGDFYYESVRLKKPGSSVFIFPGKKISFDTSGTSFTISLELFVVPIEKSAQRTINYTISATSYDAGVSGYYPEQFTLRIPQIGFDINEQALLGAGKTIAMKSGKCAGREFRILNCAFTSNTQSWVLTCGRYRDDSLATLFPNSNYHIEEGDRYVLLDIAMPPMYIDFAAGRLLKAAQARLADIDHEVHMYDLDIDAKLVYNDNRVLREGMYIHLVKDEIVDNGGDYVLIENIEIDEGGSNIPTYSVRLMREKYWTIPILSCFGSGKWISAYPWIGSDKWKNNE